MQTGERGIILVKKWEKLMLRAYKCPAGIWTIGYGHTKNVVAGDSITVAVANSLLASDLKEPEIIVNRLCRNLTQNQFDALVSFVFNAGSGNFIKSTLLKKVQNNPNDPSIADEFKRWIYASATGNGIDDDGDGLIDEAGEKRVLPGLVDRRSDEAALYFKK